MSAGPPIVRFLHAQHSDVAITFVVVGRARARKIKARSDAVAPSGRTRRPRPAVQARKRGMSTPDHTLRCVDRIEPLFGRVVNLLGRSIRVRRSPALVSVFKFSLRSIGRTDMSVFIIHTNSRWRFLPYCLLPSPCDTKRNGHCLCFLSPTREELRVRLEGGSLIKLREVFDSCCNPKVAAAALASIGGDVAASVRAVAARNGVPAGDLVAQLVREFREHSCPSVVASAEEAVSRSEMPVLAVLQQILAHALVRRTLVDQVD